jgi:hypothetical protein
MDMSVGVIMPVVMGMAVRMAMSMVVLMGVGRGGNHAKDVIL